MLDALEEDDRYTDLDLNAGSNPGEISPADLARLHEMVVGSLADRAAFALWFGAYITAPKNERLDWAPEEQVSAADLAGGEGPPRLERNPAIRFSFIRQDADGVTLFADGQTYACSGPAVAVAERICSDMRFALDPDVANIPAVSALIVDLINRGCLASSERD
jgi:50S ribosomal protein L16 3-hydroxylase